ncbi:class I SAM-dependent methyltransferase [Chloroflexia bacterium SDU3-3]|nr:class I SAM-dependent methyltransferase [Chloroflexia bacterium SDU3-3]
MTSLRERWTSYIDRQHQQPSGPVGRVIGERMVRQHAPENAWAMRLLQIGAGDRVLDLGCGPGLGLALALQCSLCEHIVGLDLSPTMLRSSARRNRAALAEGRLALMRGDLASLPLRDAQFDKVLSIHTLYFWPEPMAVFQRIIGLLAPGGRSATIFATARTEPTGERTYWPLHAQAAALAEELGRTPGVRAQLATGPDSRQFNNLAIVLERR